MISSITSTPKTTYCSCFSDCNKVARFAAVFFMLLSLAIGYTLYHYNLTQYLVIPFATFILSLIALSVAYCNQTEAKSLPIKGAKKSSPISESADLSPLLAKWLSQPLDMSEVNITFTKQQLAQVNAPIVLFGENTDFDDDDVKILAYNGYNETHEFLSNDFSGYSNESFAAGTKEFTNVSHFYSDAEQQYDPEDRIKLMKMGVWKKFTEVAGGRLGPDLRNTGKRALYNGQKEEAYWGCVLTHSNSGFTLRGKNLLGKLLTELRQILQREAEKA